MPSFANNPFGPPQQNTGGGMATAQPAVMAEPQVINPSTYTNYGQGNGGGFGSEWERRPRRDAALGGGFGGGFGTYGGAGQQPAMLSDMQRPADMYSDTQYRPERQQPFGGQLGQLRQNPFQPQQPAFMQSPEYQGYQTQMQGLQQQMNDYMQKAPMYQQLQDLQGKMQGYHDNYARQQQQQMMQRPSPFRRGQFQQPMGLQGLMGMPGGRGGMAQLGSYEQYVDSNSGANSPLAHVRRGPTMSRADFEARQQQLMSRLQPRMSMGMPQARGFESDYRALMKNGGKV
jgi:hypothetical protein